MIIRLAAVQRKKRGDTRDGTLLFSSLGAERFLFSAVSAASVEQAKYTQRHHAMHAIVKEWKRVHRAVLKHQGAAAAAAAPLPRLAGGGSGPLVF